MLHLRENGKVKFKGGFKGLIQKGLKGLTIHINIMNIANLPVENKTEIKISNKPLGLLDILDRLPKELHFNIIKYLQHPLTILFNKHITTTDWPRSDRRRIAFNEHNGARREPIILDLKENHWQSVKLDHKIKFPKHPVVDMLRRGWYRYDNITKNINDIGQRILFIKRRRLRMAAPSFRLHNMIETELKRYKYHPTSKYDSFKEFYFKTKQK